MRNLRVLGALTLSRPVVSIVGLIFALGWPLVFLLLPAQQHQNLTNLSQDRGVLVAEWGCAIVLALVVIFWERLALFVSTGFVRPQRTDAIIIAVLIVLTIAYTGVVWSQRATLADPQMLGLAAIPFGLRLALVFTAGICEEFFFRGYAIERLTALTGRPWLAGLGATLFFTLAHVARYGFSQSLLVVAVIAAALSFLYVWRRNIWPCIVLHWVIDGTTLLIAASVVTHAH
jgi:membrane protease YdiL (CAAX protease family)